MPISDWKDMFPHEITHYEFADRDNYGAAVYATPATYKARIIRKPTRVRDIDGHEVVARGKVWLLGKPLVTTQDKIELPDGTSPPIIQVETFPDQSDDHHTCLYFG